MEKFYLRLIFQNDLCFTQIFFTIYSLLSLFFGKVTHLKIQIDDV